MGTAQNCALDVVGYSGSKEVARADFTWTANGRAPALRLAEVDGDFAGLTRVEFTGKSSPAGGSVTVLVDDIVYYFR